MNGNTIFLVCIITVSLLFAILIVVLARIKKKKELNLRNTPIEPSHIDKMNEQTQTELQPQSNNNQSVRSDQEMVEYLKELRDVKGKEPTQPKKDKSQLNFDFQHALFLNDSGRSEEAFQLMKQTADAGHTRAQFNTGVFYAQGHGVKQDYGMAVIYYSMAAMLGDRDANYNLGLLFYLGQGVEQPDYNKAVSYYTTAALLGDYLAMAALSYCYRNGKGVEKDEEEASKWTKEALNAPGSNMFSVIKVWEIMDSGNPSNISYSG